MRAGADILIGFGEIWTHAGGAVTPENRSDER